MTLPFKVNATNLILAAAFAYLIFVMPKRIAEDAVVATHGAMT